MSVHAWVRLLAARWCRPATLDRLILPVLTDAQVEYEHAMVQGRVWKARAVWLAGYVALLRVVALHACERATHDWSRADGLAVARTAGVAVVGCGAATSLLVGHAIADFPTGLWFYLVPQALLFAIPIGMTLGIFCGLGGRVVTRRQAGSAFALALACSAGSLATTMWVVPEAAVAYRAALSQHVHLATGKDVTLTLGPSAIGLRQLRSRIDALANRQSPTFNQWNSGHVSAARNAAFVYYVRWALPCAPAVLALFALSFMPRRPVRYWTLIAGAFSICVAYYVLLLAAGVGSSQPGLPVVMVVWLPNVLFGLGATAGMVNVARASRAAEASRTWSDQTHRQ